MKLIHLLMIVFIAFSCSAQTQQNQKNQTDSKDNKISPDSNVALKFINGYVDFCSQNPSAVKNWINNNTLLTNNFKKSYNSILESAYKEDPELGLDFDPVFDAQDFPEKGFELVSIDNNTGYVVVKGKEWPEFVLVLRLVNQNNKWLVDGSGVINIQESKRAKR